MDDLLGSKPAPPLSAYVAQPLSLDEIDRHPDSARLWATILRLREEHAGTPNLRAIYADCLRVVCTHLELPQSESGPCDDSFRYDRALDALRRELEHQSAMHEHYQKAYFQTRARLEMLEKLLRD